MDWPDSYQNEVLPRLRPADVFIDPSHDWKSRKDNRWKGSCPWHGSESGTCFTVDPETLQWYCFHCERGGGPPEYLHALNGGRGTPEGEDFVRVVKTLADKVGVSIPESDTGPKERSRDQRAPRPSKPDRKIRQESVPVRRESPDVLAGHGGPSEGRDLAVPEPKLREALLRYRDYLLESSRAREYVESRGLSIDTLYDHGCGFAPPGKWIQDDVTNEKGTHIHRAPNGRIVTPHTTLTDTSDVQLISLCGRAVPPCPEWLQKRHVDGNPTGIFNASVIGSKNHLPVVLCEGPMDALSLIEKGWKRAMALHNTSGVPWSVIKGNAEVLVFAFDNDETGQEDAVKRAREAVMRGFEAHVLPGETGAYGGEGDPNEALQAGALDLSYLAGLSDSGPDKTGSSGREERSSPREGAGEDALEGTQEGSEWPVIERIKARDGNFNPASPKDLVSYWGGQDIGYLGRWVWTAEIPVGAVEDVLYADRSLHRWIVSELEKGPGEAEDTERLRWVLWRLYAAYGPEKVPEWQVPDPPESEVHLVGDSREDAPGFYDLGSLPRPVDTWPAEAPTPCQADPRGRGIALDTPYDEEFIRDLKSTIPEWALEWRDRGGVWVVDDMLASLVGDMLRSHFG